MYGDSFTFELMPRDDYFGVDYSVLDGANLGYAIADLDGDGQEELLLATCLDDRVGLYVYEYENDEVVKDADWEQAKLRNETYHFDYTVEMDLCNTQSERGGVSDVSELFLYEMNGKTFIGYEHHALAALFSDGVNATFLCLKYQDKTLSLVQDVIYNGSDMDPVELGYADDDLKEIDIHVNVSDWIEEGRSLLRDIKWTQRIFGIRASNKLTYEEAFRWQNNSMFMYNE